MSFLPADLATSPIARPHPAAALRGPGLDRSVTAAASRPERDRAVRLQEGSGGGTARDWLLLAMAHHRPGHARGPPQQSQQPCMGLLLSGLCDEPRGWAPRGGVGGCQAADAPA